MQSKNKFITLTIVITVIAAVLLILFLPKNNYEVGTFSLSEYYHPDEEVIVIKNVGDIPDARTAVKKARVFLTERFIVDPLGDDPAEIYWDETARCWLVVAALPKVRVDTDLVEEIPLYELPYVIIRENGDVLKFGEM